MLVNLCTPDPIDPATLSVGRRNVTKKGYATMDLLQGGKKMVLDLENIPLYINQFKNDHGEGFKVVFSWKPSEEWLNFFLALETTVKTFAMNNKDKVFDNAYFPNASIEKNLNAIVADAKVDNKTGQSYRRAVNFKGSTNSSGAFNTKVTNFNDEDRTIEEYFKMNLLANVLVEISPLYVMAGNTKWGIQLVVKRMQVTQSDSMEEYQFKRRPKEPALVLGPPLLEDIHRKRPSVSEDEHGAKRPRLDSE